MKKPSWINMNVLGLVILLVGYLVGLGMVLSRSWEEGALSETHGEGKKVVTLMHWQLEPGYRDAMQAVMDRYNQLPHVQAANVEVRQLDVSERVYAQVLNVHLISGTAPDLSEKGMSGIFAGAGMAQYFDSISGFAGEPNPYNAPQYLPSDMDPELGQALATMPWRETFIDGMQGGWVPELQDFYSAPTSFFGSQKIFYNVGLFEQAKAILREASATDDPPAWFQGLFLRVEDGAERGYVRDTPALREWLASGRTPDTLGRLLMLNVAIEELARRTGNPQLVPIAGSHYSDLTFAGMYLVPFTAPLGRDVDYDLDASVTGAETWLGLRAGHWSFQHPRVAAYFDCVREIARYFPPGFLGLDREQARRRFVTAQAAMIATGSWDAQSLFDTVDGVPLDPDKPLAAGQTVTVVDGVPRVDYRFDIKIMNFPQPGPDERWYEHTTYPASTARANGGASYAIYQRSPNKRWALDFLRYLTSYQINEWFNHKAGWLPIVVGADPLPRLDPFTPTVYGINPNHMLGFRESDGRQMRTRFDGQSRSYLAGDLSYEEFTRTLEQAAADNGAGVTRVIFAAQQGNTDRVRNFQQLLNTQIAATDLMRQAAAEDRYLRSVRQSALLLNASDLPRTWERLFPDEPFPDR